MPVVVDTNVLAVANGPDKCPQASTQCTLACIRRLRSIMDGGGAMVIDTGWRILNEYKQQVSESGEPGAGDAFLEWLLQNRNRSEHCQWVVITENSARSFEEFPEDDDLSGFDLSDRKFVAVACAHPEHPPILNAVDSDWREFEGPLSRYVQIDFLCP